MYTQELGAAHSLHGRTIDGQRSMQRVHSPEVNDNLLRLSTFRERLLSLHHPQAAHLAPVVCLISVADETHHSRVIRKFNEAVKIYLMKSESSLTLHRQGTTTIKAQKGSKGIIEIVHVTSVVQPSFYEATRMSLLPFCALIV